MIKIRGTRDLYLDDNNKIWNKRTQKYQSLVINNCGYQVFSARMLKGGSSTLLFHRVLWSIRKGKIPPGLVINHLNGIKHDNRIENLECVTHQENINHALDTLGYREDRKSSRKLSESDIRSLRYLMKKGRTLKECAMLFGVHEGALSNITRTKSKSYIEHRGTFERPFYCVVKTRKRGKSIQAYYHIPGKKQVCIGSSSDEEKLKDMIKSHVASRPELMFRT